MRKDYLYQHYTWILRIGSVEDHGPHLPLDTDNFLVWNICEEAARRADGDILLLPQIP